MSLLVALAAAAAVPTDQPTARPAPGFARATATIRILSGTTIRFSEVERTAPDTLRETRVRASDGSIRTARVVEFQ